MNSEKSCGKKTLLIGLRVDCKMSLLATLRREKAGPVLRTNIKACMVSLHDWPSSFMGFSLHGLYSFSVQTLLWTSHGDNLQRHKVMCSFDQLGH